VPRDLSGFGELRRVRSNTSLERTRPPSSAKSKRRRARRSAQPLGMRPPLSQAVTKKRVYARWWLLLVCAIVLYYLVARSPLPFVAAWWNPGGPSRGEVLHVRQRMADWMVYSKSLVGLSRAEVVLKLGRPEPSEYNAQGEDMVYVLGSARGVLTFDFIEALVLRFDQSGQVVEAKIHRD